VKQLLWTLAFAVVLIGVLFFLQEGLNDTLNYVDDSLTVLERQLDAEQWPQAEETVDKIVERWESGRKIWEMFIDHHHVDQAEASLYALQAHVHGKADSAHYKEQIAILRHGCKHILKQNKLGIGNVL
jgi:hypothetical protein